jgi:CubicO group peptidase (beta-lactamase class C family)
MSRTAWVALLAILTSRPLPAQDSVIVRGPVGQQLDSVLRSAEARGFHGNVLVAIAGQTVLFKGYGFSDEGACTRFSPSTIVQIGSNVKDFTKVAILQLVEGGLLALDDSITRFFPSVPSDKRGITVRHLLNHAAGFPMAIGPDKEVINRDTFLERLWNAPLAFRPGEGTLYSNPGYSVLAAIIEKLSGESYDRYVTDHILSPIGMRETGYLLPGFERKRLAHGYNSSGDIGTMLDHPHASDGHWWNLRGNGGFLSTLSEMASFYRTLLDGGLLKSAEDRAMVINPAPGGPSVLAGSDRTSFFLYGRFPGVRATVIIATNHVDWAGPRVLREIEPVLGIEGSHGEIATAPRVTGPLATGLPQNGAGQTIAAYFQAYNTGDSAVMRRFFETHGSQAPTVAPIGTRVQRYLQMWTNLGRLTVRGWRQIPDGQGMIAVEAGSAPGGTVTLTFVIGDGPTYPLLGVRVEVG